MEARITAASSAFFAASPRLCRLYSNFVLVRLLVALLMRDTLRGFDSFPQNNRSLALAFDRRSARDPTLDHGCGLRVTNFFPPKLRGNSQWGILPPFSPSAARNAELISAMQGSARRKDANVQSWRARGKNPVIPQSTVSFSLSLSLSLFLSFFLSKAYCHATLARPITDGLSLLLVSFPRKFKIARAISCSVRYFDGSQRTERDGLLKYFSSSYTRRKRKDRSFRKCHMRIAERAV